MIRRISFDHGWWYHYRVHNLKIENIKDNFLSLVNYLNFLFDNCPDKYFTLGPRSSHLKFKLDLDLFKVKNHEVSILTNDALKINKERYKSDHSKVQVFMLENDSKTIAVEVPLWLNPEEVEFYNRIFNSNDPLTGHIDILRVEDGKVWIWDYKPNAVKEEFAATQVYFYALMLSKRTGISLEDIRCGYFDENEAYIFKPELKTIQANL